MPRSYNEPAAGQEETWQSVVMDYSRNIATTVVCSYILFIADVYGVMTRSRRIFHNVLYVSYGAYAVFFAIWFYIILFVQRKNPNWENTHMQLIYVATMAVSVGGLMWVVALWPVFHIWTIPLGLVGLFLFLSVLALFPASKKKVE